jgi:flagellar hook-length control protein FliK
MQTSVFPSVLTNKTVNSNQQTNAQNTESSYALSADHKATTETLLDSQSSNFSDFMQRHSAEAAVDKIEVASQTTEVKDLESFLNQEAEPVKHSAEMDSKHIVLEQEQAIKQELAEKEFIALGKMELSDTRLQTQLFKQDVTTDSMTSKQKTNNSGFAALTGNKLPLLPLNHIQHNPANEKVSLNFADNNITVAATSLFKGESSHLEQGLKSNSERFNLKLDDLDKLDKGMLSSKKDGENKKRFELTLDKAVGKELGADAIKGEMNFDKKRFGGTTASKFTFNTPLSEQLNGTAQSASFVKTLESAETAQNNASLNSLMTQALAAKEVSAAELKTASTAEFNQGLNLKRDFAPNLAMRIQWMLNHAMSSAEIMMDPPDMGPLSVKIQQQNGETNIMFQVSQTATKDMIDEHLSKLKEMLEQQGLVLGETLVKQQMQQQKNQSSEEEPQSTNNGHHAQNDDEDTVLISDQIVDVYS